MAECACIAVSVELNSSDVEGIVNFDENKYINSIGGNWNGAYLNIPSNGLYHISWGFYRDAKGIVNEKRANDDVSIWLMKNPVNNGQDEKIAKAFAGEEEENYYGRKSGHHTIILPLKSGEDIYLKAEVDGGGHCHVKDIYFTLFKICCDSSIEIGGGC